MILAPVNPQSKRILVDNWGTKAFVIASLTSNPRGMHDDNHQDAGSKPQYLLLGTLASKYYNKKKSPDVHDLLAETVVVGG